MKEISNIKARAARFLAPVVLVAFAALSGVASVSAAPARPDLPSPTQIAEGAALLTAANTAYPEFGVITGVVLVVLVGLFVGLAVIKFGKRAMK
jgi:Na+/proline symporter